MSDRPPPDTAEAWLQRSRSDLAAARLILKASDVLREDVCFHAQQCAEKALKALLIHRAIPHQRTHALETLIDLLKAQGVEVPNNVDQAFSLSQYAVETRYPGEWEPITEEETQLALRMAESVLVWVEKQIHA